MTERDFDEDLGEFIAEAILAGTPEADVIASLKRWAAAIAEAKKDGDFDD